MQVYTLEARLQLFKLAHPQPVQYTAAAKENAAVLLELDHTRMLISGASIFGPDTIRQVTFSLYPCSGLIS